MVREIFSIFHEGPPNIFEDIQSQKDLDAQAWNTYHKILMQAHFPAQGKGSIFERFRQGQMAGNLLAIAYKHNLSLNAAAELLEEEINGMCEFAQKNKSIELINDELSEYPVLTAHNLIQNIWPKFKSVAHFWAALFDFNVDIQKERCRCDLIPLVDIRELSESWHRNKEGKSVLIFKPVWPTKYSGWRCFIYKSRHIFNRCKKCRTFKITTHKPLLSLDECWQVIFRNMGGSNV